MKAFRELKQHEYHLLSIHKPQKLQINREAFNDHIAQKEGFKIQIDKERF